MTVIDLPDGRSARPLCQGIALGVEYPCSTGVVVRCSRPPLRPRAAAGWRARKMGLRMWDFLLGALQTYAFLNNGELSHGLTALARLAKCLYSRRKIDVAHYHYLVCLASLLAERGAQALSHIEIANAIVLKYGGPQQHALGSLAHAQALRDHGRTRPGQSLHTVARSACRCRAASCAFRRTCARRCSPSTKVITSAASAHCKALSPSLLRRITSTTQISSLRLMARLCAFALAHGIEPDYARRLIRQRCLKSPGVEVECWPWPVKIYTLGRFSLVVDGRRLPRRGTYSTSRSSFWSP